MMLVPHRIAAAAVAAVLALAASRADGQWFKYPTRGRVPRTASGAVNIPAPTPRAPDG